MEIDSVDEAVEQGWPSYFQDEDQEHDAACPSCTEALLREDADGEWGVKEEYRVKGRYLDETGDQVWQDHSKVVMVSVENEPRKLN
jgi:hypothetical protein